MLQRAAGVVHLPGVDLLEEFCMVLVHVTAQL